MKTRILLAPLLILLAAASAASAQSKLHLRVFTSGPNGFSVNSTLIYGEKDAILIDTQFVRSEAYRVAAMILESKKNLTTVYITHGHPDHYFGIAVLKQAFPNAKFVALPATIAAIRNGWDGRIKNWTPEFGFNLPTTGPILPDELQGNALNLEGEALQVVGGVIGDGPNNSYVWIPSLHAVIAGDIVFSGSHFNPPKMPEEWLKTLDQIADLKPITVIPGHERAGARNDASTIAFMKAYIKDYNEALDSSKTAAEFRSKMVKKYPNFALERLIVSAADAAFPSNKK
ncbi:MAG TPA: MBL fold metallo-hydrolase [Bryobacteraceae bacterium]|nr:MBL fold metallo-hydrolase [Bryobacteraceae bacterium]